MGKPTTCIGENKDADQLRSNCEADQYLCFHYSDSTIPLLLKSEILRFYLFSVLVQTGLCRTCSETTLLVFPRDGSFYSLFVCLFDLSLRNPVNPCRDVASILRDFYPTLYCVYIMFPAAPAAPFARNVACRGVLVIYFSDFQDPSRFVTFSYVVLRYP